MFPSDRVELPGELVDHIEEVDNRRGQVDLKSPVPPLIGDCARIG